MKEQRNNGESVTRILREKWQAAQKAEYKIWEKSGARIVSLKFAIHKIFGNPRKTDLYYDDWNFWWMDKFDGYSFLPKRLDKAIEIGCGPFSNMRLILKRMECSDVYLSDPLIKEYVKHTKGFVSNAVKKGEVLIDNSPAEDLPYKDNYFDLVVMINVLDHVMDAEKAIDSCRRITKKGGFLILGQDLKNEEDIQKRHSDLDDILHPIKFPHLFLDGMLEGIFAPVYFKLLPRGAGRVPEYHYGTYIYAGRKI